ISSRCAAPQAINRSFSIGVRAVLSQLPFPLQRLYRHLETNDRLELRGDIVRGRIRNPPSGRRHVFKMDRQLRNESQQSFRILEEYWPSARVNRDIVPSGNDLPVVSVSLI